MFPLLHERPSDSPFIQRVWSTRSEQPGAFTTLATTSWSLVVARSQGRVSVSVHGPVTQAARQEFPPGAEWFGIEFAWGTFSPTLSPLEFVDGFQVLPSAGGTFEWGSSRWEIPSLENADTFIARAVRDGMLEREPMLDPRVGADRPELSPRMAQYRVVRATGLSLRTAAQIERARQAAELLKSGVPILDTVDALGYSDQPHLTRAMKRFIGCTPREVPSSVLVGLPG